MCSKRLVVDWELPPTPIFHRSQPGNRANRKRSEWAPKVAGSSARRVDDVCDDYASRKPLSADALGSPIPHPAE
jgi:hypothetical protein